MLFSCRTSGLTLWYTDSCVMSNASCVYMYICCQLIHRSFAVVDFYVASHGSLPLFLPCVGQMCLLCLLVPHSSSALVSGRLLMINRMQLYSIYLCTYGRLLHSLLWLCCCCCRCCCCYFRCNVRLIPSVCDYLPSIFCISIIKHVVYISVWDGVWLLLSHVLSLLSP